MDQVWDPRGEADVALTRVVEGFGPQVLGRADMLEGLLHDDVPQLPREVALLTAAARSGVADLLAERVQQGISPQAAVSMAAAEMTARTAVDASGAPWAAGVFARVLGYPVPGPAIPAAPPTAPLPAAAPTAPVPAAPPTAPFPPAPVPPAPVAAAPPTAPVPTPPVPPAPVPAPPTAPVPTGGRDAWGRPVPDLPRPDQEAIRPYGDQVVTVPPPVEGGGGLAAAAAVTAGIAALMPLSWALIPGTDAAFWLTTILLIAGLGGAAIWAARGWRGGAGFAAVLGVALPAASWGIFDAAAAPSLNYISGLRRHLLELTSVVWVVAALAAAGIAIAGLARWHQLRRYKPGPLPVALAAAGIGYALANIMAQEKFQGQIYSYVLGPGVRGWWILWGIAFLVLASAPPVLAAFLLPDSGVRLAVWAGLLLVALARQVIDTPTGGFTAAPGLYVTWILWVVALAGTAVMAGRRRAGAAA